MWLYPGADVSEFRSMDQSNGVTRFAALVRTSVANGPSSATLCQHLPALASTTDLTVTRIELRKASEGKSIVAVSVRNNATSAPYAQIGVGLSVDGTLFETMTATFPKPGETVEVLTELPSSLVQSKPRLSIGAAVDPYQLVIESNEDNNTLFENFQLAP